MKEQKKIPGTGPGREITNLLDPQQRNRCGGEADLDPSEVQTSEESLVATSVEESYSIARLKSRILAEIREMHQRQRLYQREKDDRNHKLTK